MRYIQPVDRAQCVMMNTLDDLVPEQHPVRIIDTIVDQVVTANPEQFGQTDGDSGGSSSEPGRPAFSPQTMLKLFLYGYLINCRSSRKLEAETTRNIELIWLLGTLSPDHWVIAQYRRVHGDHIKAVTKAFRQFLHAHGYITGERVAIDGTKMKANARRDMLTIEKIDKRLQHLDEQLAEYLSKLAENDVRDDLAEELDGSDGSVPVDQHLLEKVISLQRQVDELTAHRATLEQQQSGKQYLSPSDPDASLMKSRDGKVPAYNVQIVVDSANHMIAATEVLEEPEDHHALPVMVTALKEELGITPTEITADKGYYTPDLIQQVETTTSPGTTCYVPVPDKPDDPAGVTFRYDESADCYVCSEGKLLVLHQKNKRKKGSLTDVYRGRDCVDCRVRAQCTRSKHGRTVHRYHNQDWRDRFGQRMQQAGSRVLVGLRKCLVEHPFGTIKLWGGRMPLLLRGIQKVAIEVSLYATTYNLKRLLQEVCASSRWDTLVEQLAVHRWKLV